MFTTIQLLRSFLIFLHKCFVSLFKFLKLASTSNPRILVFVLSLSGNTFGFQNIMVYVPLDPTAHLRNFSVDPIFGLTLLLLAFVLLFPQLLFLGLVEMVTFNFDISKLVKTNFLKCLLTYRVVFCKWFLFLLLYYDLFILLDYCFVSSRILHFLAHL